MLTALDYIAIYWLGINGVEVVEEDATPYPSDEDVRVVMEKPIDGSAIGLVG